MGASKALIRYIIDHQTTLIQTDFARELFMIADRQTAVPHGQQFLLESDAPLYAGKLFINKADPHWFYSVADFERIYSSNSDVRTFLVTATKTDITYDQEENDALCTPQDSFILNPGDIENYKGDTPIETTIGIFMANYLFFVYPFGNCIDYLNEEFSASKMEKRIELPLLDGRINTKDYKNRYVNTLNLFGQSTEIICPNITEKTISIPQDIHDLREKLVNENREALEAGDASVMSDIEKQLITAYRSYLQGDPSLHFLLKAKYFNVTLKKLFLTQGMTEVFGSPGKFVFIEQPMGSGWKEKDLPAIFNEVRSGSYSRAVETANGGVIAKSILRVFQDTRIDTPDCQTTRGEHIHATKDNLKDFIWNYVVGVDDQDILITETNISELVGKNLVIRTPGFCQAPQGFCAKCFGSVFETLGVKAFAPIANDFARNQTTASLKRMHGVSHNTVDVSNITRYLIV